MAHPEKNSALDLALEVGRGPRAKEYEQPAKARKVTETDSPLELPRRNLFLTVL